MIGVLLKRVPKFGFLLGYSWVVGEGYLSPLSLSLSLSCVWVYRNAYIHAYMHACMHTYIHAPCMHSRIHT